jgi:hypothetical protein
MINSICTCIRSCWPSTPAEIEVDDQKSYQRDSSPVDTEIEDAHRFVTQSPPPADEDDS